MKLDRNTEGRGKYAIINLRDLDRERAGALYGPALREAIDLLEQMNLIQYGAPGTEDEFFVMKLKDRFAQKGLQGYSKDAMYSGHPEYGAEINELANRAGRSSPWCKDPD